ncbi:MAG: amidase [Myxococcota bacterium]|nr:amidase [Myxococcota bacterium]
MSDLLLRSGSELAGAIARGEIAAVDVVRAHIEHLRRVEPRLRAVAGERCADALREAAAFDRLRREAGPEALPRWAGVPCTVKEAIALAGMPNSGGSWHRRAVRATEDAPAVARLRAAGLVPVAVGNASELGVWMETINPVHGRTRNAYDRRRTAGGSTGGDAALVGAGAVPVALGADGGGSIRIPAFFNGVFGHKPSAGLVPIEGQFPLPTGPAARLVAVGPIARRAADLWPVLRLLAGEGDGAAGGDGLRGDPACVEVRALRVLDVRDPRIDRLDAALDHAQRRAVSHLRSLGCDVRATRLDAFDGALEVWLSVLASSRSEPFERLAGGGEPLRLAVELLRAAIGRPRYTLPTLAMVALERVARAVRWDHGRALRRLEEVRARVLDLVAPDAVLLCPPHPVVAPRHREPLLHPRRAACTALFNLLEMPATAVPMGLDARGLPVGVQVAAAPGLDALPIAVALELERAFGGWVPPPWTGLRPTETA